MLRLVNFILLAFILLRVFGRNFREFLFRRRMRLRREMVDSVVALKLARARSLESREAYESLPGEIMQRRAAISRRCEAECRSIIDEAKARAGRVLAGAERLAERERIHIEARTRRRLVDMALAEARERLAESARQDGGAFFAERALGQLAARLGAGGAA